MTPDAATFTDAFRRWHGPMRDWLCSIVGDTDLADDITSETFFKACRAWDGYREQASLRTWLFTIAKNTLKDYWKMRRVTEPLDDLRQHPQIIHSWSDIDEWMDTRAAMSHLCERRQRALLLAAEGYSATEAALALGMDANAFHQLVFQARERLTRLTR